MYTLKSIIRRTPLLGTVLALAIAPLLPVSSAFADALNPLTERSLTLSSSSPGWANTDGSGNSTYAPPNSGANGQKTGNYFSFKVSSTATVKTMSFQYCTTSAGACTIPGNGSFDVSAQKSNLDVHYPSAAPVANADFNTVIDASSAHGDVKAVPGYTNSNPKYSGSGDPAEAAKNVAGNFIVMSKSGGTWAPSAGWAASSQTVADTNAPGGATKNYIILTNTGTGMALTAGQEVKVLFFATDTNYITNPGAGAFFVKINTYGVTYDGTTVTTANLQPASDANVIDGGVTVANVMNQSIQITTKVLETMEFSVGTVDPDTLTNAEFGKADGGPAAGPKAHIPCDTIRTAMVKGDPQNVVQLGNQSAESSLETAKAYATHSYWRLSSNSSAGATVYYSGHTLSNTVGDEIAPIGKNKMPSAPGSEQFGLAIATQPSALSGTPTFNTGTYGVSYAQDRNGGGVYENGADNDRVGIDVSQIKDMGATYAGTATLWDATDSDWTYPLTFNKSFHTPRLDPLTPAADYDSGYGKINTDSDASMGASDAQFAFDPMSDTIPTPIATESSQVVDCVTAKMRYIGNIAATTPAGIYTTKINYIAAPQY